MKEVLGNTEGLKNNIIAMLEQLYQLRVPPWQLVSPEIAIQMDALRKTADQNVDMNQLFQDTIKNTFEVFEVEV
mgnify:CR=1 FL=1